MVQSNQWLDKEAGVFRRSVV